MSPRGKSALPQILTLVGFSYGGCCGGLVMKVQEGNVTAKRVGGRHSGTLLGPGLPANDGGRGVRVQAPGPNYSCPQQRFILDLPRSQFGSAGVYFQPPKGVWGLQAGGNPFSPISPKP